MPKRAPVEVLTYEPREVIEGRAWEYHCAVPVFPDAVSAFGPFSPADTEALTVEQRHHYRIRLAWATGKEDQHKVPDTVLCRVDELGALKLALERLTRDTQVARDVLARSKTAEHRIIAERLRQDLLALFQPPVVPAPTR